MKHSHPIPANDELTAAHPSTHIDSWGRPFGNDEHAAAFNKQSDSRKALPKATAISAAATVSVEHEHADVEEDFHPLNNMPTLKYRGQGYTDPATPKVQGENEKGKIETTTTSGETRTAGEDAQVAAAILTQDQVSTTGRPSTTTPLKGEGATTKDNSP